MNRCTLYLVRHGQSEHNRDDIISGQVDPSLTNQGIQDATKTKLKLSNVHFSDVYSSDLIRAYKTASIIVW